MTLIRSTILCGSNDDNGSGLINGGGGGGTSGSGNEANGAPKRRLF